MNDSKQPILFTGGHHNSALVVALALRKRGYRVAWVGHKFTSGEKSLSAEYQEVTRHNIPFFELKTGKFYRRRNPLEYLMIIIGFFQSFNYLLRIKPSLIVSFGGYLAVPVVIAGYFLRIPAVTHEQTVTAGFANKAITPFVKKIFLTHRSSLKNYPPQKSVVTGLPIDPQFFHPKPYQSKRPLIFVTCGKQGSHIINQAVFPLVPLLTQKYKLIHQTGTHVTTKDQDRARRVKSALPKAQQPFYVHQPYFFRSDALKYLGAARLTISRAGAHTIYELLLLNKRHIVIPIPWVSHNEQLQNAQILKQRTTAVILPEKDLTPELLLTTITKILRIKRKDQSKEPVITDGVERIIKQLLPYLS